MDWKQVKKESTSNEEYEGLKLQCENERAEPPALSVNKTPHPILTSGPSPIPVDDAT